MNSEKTLDEHQIIQSNSIIKHRSRAIILEVLPAIAFIISLLSGDHQSIFLSFLLLVTIYLFGGWYLFKADKYKVKDIIFVELVILLSIVLLLIGILYKILNWPGANDMLYLSFFFKIFFFFVLCIRYYIYRNRPLEWRLSAKLLLRIAIFLTINFFLIG